MKTGRIFRFSHLVSVAMVGVWLAGCATQATRIKENQALFDTLSSDAQARIREGNVAIGFTPEMVKLAVGEPDRRAIRTDATGRTEIWSYTRYESVGGAPVYTGYSQPFHPGYRYYGGAFYAEGATAREYFRVEFADGVVMKVQQQSK